MWAFTSDLSVRMRTGPAPGRIEAVNTIVRRGRRSATCQVELTADDGRPVATGAIGFVSVPARRVTPRNSSCGPTRPPASSTAPAA